MERVIYTRVYQWLELNDKLSKYQFGFRSSRGTADAVFNLINNLYRSKDKGKVVAACFLDVRKAFDSIHHGELLKRLTDLGIPPLYTNWFSAYLSNRSQSVICNDTQSNILPVKFGVPQGSILGPLLFLCYINNLPSILKHCTISMYADDVVFYVEHQSSCIAENLLQADASRVYDWFCQSGLCINTEKTQVLMFNNNKDDPPPTIKMGGTVLKVCLEYEYLGITIDNNLNFDKNTGKTISSASRRLYLLCKMRKMIPKSTACLIYKQTILPVLDYCSYLNNGLTNAVQQRLQRVQNRCLRVCLKTNRRHRVTDLHSGCRVDYLDVRADLQLLLLIRKYIYSDAHAAEDFGIVSKVAIENGVRTRSIDRMELIYPTDNKISYRRCPLYRGIDLWNKLPPTCRTNPSVDSFKLQAKSILSTLSDTKWRRLPRQ